MLAAALVAASAALAAPSAAGPPIAMTVKDLTPRFLAFYRAAQGATPDQRWNLWKRDYDFAAVPPTPAGDAMARGLLDGAWARYPVAIGRIERGAAGIAPPPLAVLHRVTALLRPTIPVHVELIVYVGTFEGNAFTVAMKPGEPVVSIPVEATAAERGPTMAHEFTHAVQIAMGTMRGGWVRSVGETVLAEGLAMRVAEYLYPDRPPLSFVEITPGWFARSERQRDQILGDVRTAAPLTGSDDVMRFTMGTGPAGIDREAYFAGWLVVGYWLTHGLTYADIARIPEADAPARVCAAIDAMLAAHRSVARPIVTPTKLSAPRVAAPGSGR